MVCHCHWRRIPQTRDAGGLLSKWSQRVGHDRSDLAHKTALYLMAYIYCTFVLFIFAIYMLIKTLDTVRNKKKSGSMLLFMENIITDSSSLLSLFRFSCFLDCFRQSVLIAI